MKKVIILLGPPGSGKGTQGLKLADSFGIPQISTGDILRHAIKVKSPLGEKAHEYVSSGKLVPDEIMISLIGERISEPDCQPGFILDGFPRTISQAEGLEDILINAGIDVDHVVNFNIELSSLIKRLVNRRTCSGCGKIYNLITMPPLKEGVCDDCGSSLFQRNDDREETIRERFSVYERQTEPLINYYRQKSVLKEVDASVDKDEIFKLILKLLEK